MSLTQAFAGVFPRYLAGCIKVSKRTVHSQNTLQSSVCPQKDLKALCSGGVAQMLLKSWAAEATQRAGRRCVVSWRGVAWLVE